MRITEHVDCSMIKIYKPLKGKKCRWTYDEVDNAYYRPCGFPYMLTEGNLKDNAMNYCPKCGRPIYAVRPKYEKKEWRD